VQPVSVFARCIGHNVILQPALLPPIHDKRLIAGRGIAALGLALTPEQLLDSPHALIGPAGRVRERLAELRERWGFGAVTAYEADLPSLLPVFASLGS